MQRTMGTNTVGNDCAIKISRQWAMPNKNTFSIKPIREIIDKYATGLIIDPFANTSKIANITNDINPSMDTMYHLDATDFLKMFQDESVDTVLYDPPIFSTSSIRML